MKIEMALLRIVLVALAFIGIIMSETSGADYSSARGKIATTDPKKCLSSVTAVKVESYVFPPRVNAPGGTKSFFLGGAGVRGLEIEGKFVKFTAIGVYLEKQAFPLLANKWKGKNANELNKSVEFFRDIVTGPYKKFTQVTMVLPLSGKEYSGKVAENCVAYWKSIGTYTDAERLSIQKFLEVFKTKDFQPGASILFTQSPSGTLTISFTYNGVLPKKGEAVIQNKQLSEAVLESIIGVQGVSPAAKWSLADRISKLSHECETNAAAVTNIFA